MTRTDTHCPSANLTEPINSGVCDQSLADVQKLEAEIHAPDCTDKLKVEVIADDSGTYCGNGLRFDSAETAIAYGHDLHGRWMLVRKWRVAIDRKDV